MASIKIWIGEMFGTDQVGKIFACRRDRHDQADMYTVGFDEYGDSPFRFARFPVGRNETSGERCNEVKTHDQKRPTDNGPQSASKTVDPKKFQV